ncbi:hypothetical protein JCM11641_001097 [Rhodosporidiobolus odoratus]
MSFQEGFVEDHDPLQSDQAATDSTSSSSQPQPSTSQDDTLDLTEDSPPPAAPRSRLSPRKKPQADAFNRWLSNPVGSRSSTPTGMASYGGYSPAGNSGNGFASYSAGASASNGPGGGFAGGFMRPTSSAIAQQKGLAYSPYPFPASAIQAPQVSGPASASQAGVARQLQGGAVHQHPLASLSSSALTNRHVHVAPQQNLGRIPVIFSATNARMPSHYLPQSSSAYAQAGPSRLPIHHVAHASPSVAQAAAHGASFPSFPSPSHSQPQSSVSPQKPVPQNKKRNKRARSSNGSLVLSSDSDDQGVVDITSALSSDEDDLIVDDTPICIGQITTNALITDPFYPLIPPAPALAFSSDEEKVRAHGEKQEYDANPVHDIWLKREGKTWNSNAWRDILRAYVVLPATEEYPRGRAKDFGFVNYEAADVLGPLLGEGDGWIGRGVRDGEREGGRVWVEAKVEKSKERSTCFMRLHLLLFSRPQYVPSISNHLERATPQPLYLDHPTPLLSSYSGFLYKNPHNPAEGVGARGRAAEQSRRDYSSGLNGGGGVKVVKQADLAREQVLRVFGEMKSGTDLEEVTPPSIVSTPLYPHQKQALSFLLDREDLPVVPARDKPGKPGFILGLWQRVNDPYGRVKGWRSLVSDIEVQGERAPPQSRGAILADDMGLGKTIVVISLVCTSLPTARTWASQPMIPDKLDNRLEETLTPADFSSAGRAVSTSDFASHVWGLGAGGSASIADAVSDGSGKKMSKKNQKKQKKEMKKDEEVTRRFGKLECRSRATLIVCPLSTVQNWEAQFEEHARGSADEHGVGGEKAFELGGGGAGGTGAGKKDRKGKKRALVADSEEEGDAGDRDSIVSASSSDSEDAAMKKKDKKPKPGVSIYIYHGNSRISDPKKLANFDIVITTFSTLGTEFSKQQRAEEEREEEEEREQKRKEEEDEGVQVVYGFGADGEVLTKPPDEGKKPKRKRKKVEGNGISPLQAVQWFRVVLDEAHIIKEHKTIQARAACDLYASRRVVLTGTPLQNSLNDIFSLLRFLRLEPFTERHVWTQYIGALAQKGENLGTERLQLIMRHIALRRTKDTKDENGKPILALPPIDNKVISLELTEAERAFYASHHSRYKHDFAKLDESDSLMKNYCSILQELLKLRQICVHPALLQDAEDRAGGITLDEVIRKHGISKPRAIQLLALYRDAQSGDCAECGNSMAAFGRPNVEELGGGEEDVKPGKKPPAKKRKTTKATGATSSGVKPEDGAGGDGESVTADETTSCIVTRCQHIFCRQCFVAFTCPRWPNVKGDDKVECRCCQTPFLPALDAVEVEAREFQKALERAQDELVDGEAGGKSKKKKKADKKTRLFEHSTKTRALLSDLLPFSRTNPSSENYDPSFNPASLLDPEGRGGTIGFQPVQGDIVKSVVFSQWTTLLDRLGDALEHEHIKYRRLDGAMSRESRNDSMDAFKTDPETEVLLVSLRAGGVGLNLTAGRRVYLMEPYWNPAIENQAVDRIYRLGQTRPVQTVRFVVDKSIESNMLKIQKRKMDLANMSVGRTKSKAELARERKEEILILLGD